MKLRIPLLSVPLLLAGCGQMTKQADTAGEEQTIRNAEIEWSKAAAAKDVEKIMTYYAEDAAMFPANAPLAMGKSNIKATWTGMMAMPGIAISWTPIKVDVAKSGDMAWDHGTYTLSFMDAAGKTQSDRGKYVVVWKKQPDGSWKVSGDIFNSDLPVPQPQGAAAPGANPPPPA